MRVLIVEDSFPVAAGLEFLLQSAGCDVVGKAGNVRAALEIVAAVAFDVALLDIDLGGEHVAPVADAIRQAEINAAVMASRPAPQPVDDFQPVSKLFQQPQPVQARPQPPVAPVAAPQPQAAPRMPKVEDFPPVVRAEVEARRNPPAEPENNGPMGLLKRLTTGLSRREEEPARLQPAAPREPIGRAAEFLSALQVIVGVALVVSGVRDV